MDNIYIPILLAFLCIVVILLLRPKQAITMRKSRIGITGCSILYTDQKEEKANKKENVVYGKILYSPKYNIQGKPDYIFKKWSGQLIPMELKSGSISDDEMTPHAGDLIQLAAYFLIVEDVYGVRPKEGRLVYKNKMFIIRNTKNIRRQVEATIDDMRKMLKSEQGVCEPSFVKCRYCMCRGTVCDYCK